MHNLIWILLRMIIVVASKEIFLFNLKKGIFLYLNLNFILCLLKSGVIHLRLYFLFYLHTFISVLYITFINFWGQRKIKNKFCLLLIC